MKRRITPLFPVDPKTLDLDNEYWRHRRKVFFEQLLKDAYELPAPRGLAPDPDEESDPE